MRERVALYGGELRRRPARGRRLTRCERRLPLEAAHAVIRVLVADDQALVRGGFRMILDAQTDIEVVGEAGDGREALAAVRAQLRPTSSSWTSACPSSTASRRPAGCSPASHGSRVLILTTFDARRVRLRGDEGRRQRLPAQGRPARAARRRGAHGRRWRRAPRARDHPPPRRAVRSPPATRYRQTAGARAANRA